MAANLKKVKSPSKKMPDPDPTDPGPGKKGCWGIFSEQNGG